MAIIIQMESKRQAANMLRQEHSGGAQIVFFTGVRFERLESTSEYPSEKSGSQEESLRNLAM